jgi:4-amino-4-deoxy-L-arabinose transferase-like glycosyltransferase
VEPGGARREPSIASTYLACLLINLLPWSLLLIPLALYERRSLVPDDPRERRAQRFIILWGVLMAIIFGLGQKMEPRYILPAGPLFAILLAGALGTRRSAADHARTGLFVLVLIALAGFGVVLALVGWSVMGPGPALIVLALFIAVISTIALATRPGGLPLPIGVGFAVFLAFRSR